MYLYVHEEDVLYDSDILLLLRVYNGPQSPELGYLFLLLSEGLGTGPVQGTGHMACQWGQLSTKSQAHSYGTGCIETQV